MMEYLVHNLFSTEAGVAWLILKWVLVVLAAGFIGQFGKSFAKYLMQRAQKRQNQDAAPALKPEAPRPAVQEEEVLPASGPIAERVDAARLREEREIERNSRGKGEKKALKERGKARKKTLKGIKKLFK